MMPNERIWHFVRFCFQRAPTWRSMAARHSRRPRSRCVLATALVAHATAAPLNPASYKTNCDNRHHSDAECVTWHQTGECDKNPSFMKIHCAKTCGTCGWTDNKCADREHRRPAKRNGEIHATFERALTFTQYGPRVHSRPPEGPWIITFDNFLEQEEAESFITTTDEHFQRSLAGDMVSPVRTSQQAWCQHGIAPDCERRERSARAIRRLQPAARASSIVAECGWAVSRRGHAAHRRVVSLSRARQASTIRSSTAFTTAWST